MYRKRVLVDCDGFLKSMKLLVVYKLHWAVGQAFQPNKTILRKVTYRWMLGRSTYLNWLLLAGSYERWYQNSYEFIYTCSLKIYFVISIVEGLVRMRLVAS